MDDHSDADRVYERVCPQCGATENAPTAWRCELCDVPYDLSRWSNPSSLWPRAETGLWRFKEWLPRVRRVSLGEPETPLVDLSWGSAGVTVSAKLEGLLPTGSFKDRGSALLVGWLASEEVTEIVVDSSGNAGASLAGYCAAAGIHCIVYAPATASAGKLAQIRAYGAEVVQVDGSRAQTTEAAVSAAGAAIYASHMWNPYFLVGTQTFAFELIDQLEGRAPENVVFPLGAGTLLLGAYHGFRALRDAGMIERIPRLFGVQSSACAPLAIAMAADSRKPVQSPCGSSIAEGILIANPPRGETVLAAIRETSGSIVTVDEQAIRDAFWRLAGTGIYVEPTSAAAAAGLTRCLTEGQLALEGQVVIALTGTGLKTGDLAGRLGQGPTA
jgi:threonine synthase